ncbi:MAG TPA: hypothetical protein VGG36_03735 [Rhizomicrobium sp.]
MKRLVVSLSVAGLAALMLSGCAYDPYYDGYYRHRYYGEGYYGPPGPPPGYNGPPQDYDGPPSGQLTQRQWAKLNSPAWCNSHPQHCAELRARAGGQPPAGYDGPPPSGNGPPPNYSGPQDGPANGPPQQMQPPPQQ